LLYSQEAFGAKGLREFGERSFRLQNNALRSRLPSAPRPIQRENAGLAAFAGQFDVLHAQLFLSN